MYPQTRFCIRYVQAGLDPESRRMPVVLLPRDASTALHPLAGIHSCRKVLEIMLIVDFSVIFEPVNGLYSTQCDRAQLERFVLGFQNNKQVRYPLWM